MPSSGSNPHSSNPSEKSSKDSAKTSWRGKGQAGSQGPRYRWQAETSKDLDAGQLRKTFSYRMKVAGLSLLAFALIGTFVYYLIRKSPRTPFLAVALTGYRAPVSLNAWAREDIDGFSRLAGEVGTLDFTDLSGEWSSKELALESLEQQLQKAMTKASEAKVVVVYLSIHGVSDESGTPCVLFPKASRFDSESWLPLREILDRLKKVPESVNKLLVLDSNRIDTNWHLGILYNTFADRLRDLVDRANVPGLVILNSSGPGQFGWSSPELKGSVFGHFLLKGLAGAADHPNEGGNSDRAVTLQELFGYLEHHVAQWARENRADVQEPLLVNPAGRDFVVVYARGSGLFGRSRPPRAPAETSEEGGATETPRTSTSAHDAEIAKLWSSLDELPTRALYRFDPVGWQYFVQRLLRLEQLVNAGSACSAEADDVLQELKAALLALGRPRSLSRPLVAHSLPLAEAFDRFKEDGKARADLRLAFEKPSQDLKPEKYSYLARADVAWNGFLRNPKRDTASSHIRFIGSPDPGDEPGVIEAHFLRMLERHLEQTMWDEQAHDLVEQAAVARNQAERVAALRSGGDDPTTLPGDERCQYWIYDQMQRGDSARRLAEDRFFVGGKKLLEESRELWREAANEYEAAREVIAQVEEALRVRDQAWAELPFLAMWLTDSGASHAGSQSSDAVNDLLLPLIHDTHRLGAILDQQIYSERPDPITIAEPLQQIQRDLRALKDLFRTECDELTKAVDDQTTLRRIAATLTVPLIPAGERELLRKRYRSIAQRLHDDYPGTPVGSRRGLNEGVSQELKRDQRRGLDRLNRVVQWDEHPALALLSREKLEQAAGSRRIERQKLSADAAIGDKLHAVDESGGTVREWLASVSSDCGKWLESSTQKLAKLTGSKQATLETRSDRSQADRLVRAAAALLADARESEAEHDPIHQMRLLDLRNLLVWHCGRTLDDFWGPSDPTTQFERAFFDLAAEKYLEAAKDLCKTGVGSRPRQDEALVDRYQASADAAKRWATLTANALALGEEDDEPEMEHSVTVRLDPNVPAGYAAFFLRNSADAPVSLRAADRVGYAPRTSLPTETSTPLRYWLNRADVLASGPKLLAVALYRGHQQTLDVAIDQPKGIRIENIRPENPQTYVTVFGQTSVRGALMLILDCSWSMDEPTRAVAEGAGQRKRFDVAREAFDTILSRLEEGKHFRVGIRFYGHRVAYIKDRGFATQKQPDWKSPDGKPIADLRPGEDEERIRPIGHFTPADHADIRERLKSLRPWGVTPLYLSLVRSLREDFVNESKEAPKSVVVITDGIHYQAPEDSALKRELVHSVNDVLRESANRDNGVRVFIVGFELNVRERDAARREFERIAQQTRGQYFPANNSLELAEALEKLIPNQYAVLGADAGLPPPQDKGWADIDRRSDVILPAARVGRKNNYTILLKNTDPVVQTAVALEGGESVQLQVSDDGLRLEHRLYKDRSPKFSSPPTGKQGLPDPSDPRRQFRVGAHLPEIHGTTVRFPISIQNADPSQFSPRPAEAWLEITPVIQDVPNPRQLYSFYDLTFEEGRPVPVLSCAAPGWPQGANAADIKIWFNMRSTLPNLRPKLREVANKQRADAPLKIEGLAGVTFGVQTKPRKNPSDDYRIVVTERHPPGDPNFYSVKVQLHPPAKRTAHRFDPSANTAVHTFYLPPEVSESEIMDDYELHFTSRKALEKEAMHWSTPSPIKIPGPGELRN